MHYKYVCFYIFNFQTLLEHRYTHVYVALLAVQNIYLPFLNKVLKFNLTRICNSFFRTYTEIEKMTKNKLYKQKIGTLHLETIRLRVILFRPPPPFMPTFFLLLSLYLSLIQIVISPQFCILLSFRNVDCYIVTTFFGFQLTLESQL
jgi:hypothetical protein